MRTNHLIIGLFAAKKTIPLTAYKLAKVCRQYSTCTLANLPDLGLPKRLAGGIRRSQVAYEMQKFGAPLLANTALSLALNFMSLFAILTDFRIH